MKSLTVRNVPEGLHKALRMRAAEHGRSLEAEARLLLAEALLADVDPTRPSRRKDDPALVLRDASAPTDDRRAGLFGRAR